MADCLEKALEKFPEADREDLKSVFNALTRAHQDGFLAASGNPDASFMLKSKALLDGYRRGVQIAEIRSLRDAITAKRADTFIADPAFTGSKMRGLSGKLEGVVAWINGTHKNVKNARYAGDVLRGEMRDEQMSQFIGDLQQVTGSEATLKSKEMDAKIMEARHELANGRQLPATTDPIVANIAKAWQRLGDLQLQNVNDAGAFVTKREGHMLIRTYDPLKLEGRRDEFVQWMKENVDYKKSFERDFYVLDPQETIQNTWENVVGRKFDIPEAARPQEAIKRIGAPANMARMLERARTFEFISPAAELEFMQKWSKYPSITETIAHSIQENTRRAALIQKFGSNPGQGYLRLAQDLEPAERAVADRHWRVANGQASIVGDDPVSKWAVSIMKGTDMGALGYSTLRNVPDLGTTAATLQMGEKGFLQSQLEMVNGFVSNVAPATKTETMKLSSIGFDSMVGDFFDRNGTTQGGHALVAKTHQMFYRLIGQRWWTDTAEVGMAQAIAAGIGEKAALSFARLNENYARVLQKYGVGPVEWDVIRASAEPVERSEGEFFSMAGANGVRNLPDQLVSQIMKDGGMDTKFAARYKREVAQKLGMFFRDRIDIGMNRAGDFEKASFLNRGWAQNTAEGIAMRMIAHFKSYSYTMASKFSKAYYYENLAGKSMGDQSMTIAPVIAALTAYGYIGQAAWDIAHNRTPQNPATPKTMVDSMVRGGAGGVYGDFLLGTWDTRHGRSALSYLAGPELGKVADFGDLLTQFKEAGLERDASKVRGAAISRFVFNIVPGNLPVVRNALDYLILNDMAERMNPGYNERMKARLAKQGQEQILGE